MPHIAEQNKYAPVLDLIIIRRIPALFYDTQITELFESLGAILGSVLRKKKLDYSKGKEDRFLPKRDRLFRL
jgi:hypothetical protein